MTVFNCIAFATLLMHAPHQAPDDGAASAEAQLAVAQSALCRAHATLDAAPVVVDGAEAERLQRAAQTWVDAWDKAGRPKAPLAAACACATDATTPLYLAALTQMAQAHFDAAAQHLARARADAPAAWCAGLRLREGVCALHRHKPEEALSLLQTAQRLAPRRVAIRVATAQAYLALNRPRDTVAALKPLLTDATCAPDARELEQARALVGMAIEQDAGHISPLERTAMHNLLAMAQQKTADASTVEMATSLAEAVPRPRVQTAAALVALKAQEASIGRRLLKEAFTHATLDPDPARLLALYNVEHEGPSAALPCLTLAAERDPFNTETQMLIADLQTRAGDLVAAEHTLVALVRLEPQQAKHKTALGKVRAEGQKEHEQAPQMP